MVLDKNTADFSAVFLSLAVLLIQADDGVSPSVENIDIRFVGPTWQSEGLRAENGGVIAARDVIMRSDPSLTGGVTGAIAYDLSEISLQNVIIDIDSSHPGGQLTGISIRNGGVGNLNGTEITVNNSDATGRAYGLTNSGRLTVQHGRVAANGDGAEHYPLFVSGGEAMISGAVGRTWQERSSQVWRPAAE